MTRSNAIAPLLAALLLAAGAAAQTTKGGDTGLKGKLVTAACIATPGNPCTLLSAPEKGSLVVTTGCVEQIDVSGDPNEFTGILLNGVPLGTHCISSRSNAPPASLATGYVVNPGTQVRCQVDDFGGASFACAVTGILTK